MQDGDLGVASRAVSVVLPVDQQIQLHIGDYRLQRTGSDYPFAVSVGAAIAIRHVQPELGAVVQCELRAVTLHGYDALSLDPLADAY